MSANPGVPEDAERDVAAMSGLSARIERSHPAVPLDALDRKLLNILSRDPRISQRQLARDIGMSAPAVGDRLSRLERSGVIKGYSIQIDWAAFGYPMLVYIPIEIDPGTHLDELLEELRAIPEVEELSAVTGSYDLIARLRLRDHQHLQEILLTRFWPMRGLRRIETFLSLGTVSAEDGIVTRLTMDDVADVES